MRRRAPVALRAPALLATLALYLASSRGALASETYPAALVSDLGLSAPPGCDLCHQAAAAPVGPTDTPFGKSMVARGLVASDDASVKSALQRMRADGVDSDGDGAQDLDELSWGGNPNHADVPVGGAEMPVLYGCGWSGRPAGASPWGALLIALGLAARRRRPR
jgi:cytochrome c551/c552